MGLRRYARSPVLRSGRQFGTSQVSKLIYEGVEKGTINFNVHILQEGERLDHLAGEVYGNGRLWWVIAAASGIGWALQVPPGTRIRIPADLSQIGELVG